MTPSQPKSGEMSDSKADSKAFLSVGRSSSEDLPPARPTPMTIAAARALVRRHADVCGTNAEDEWFVYGEDFTQDAEAALNAAGVPALLAAAQCAANVLFLLQDEVKALGCNANNVPEKLRAAIALATKEIQP